MPTVQEVFDHAWHMCAFSVERAIRYADQPLTATLYDAQADAFAIVLQMHPSFEGL